MEQCATADGPRILLSTDPVEQARLEQLAVKYPVTYEDVSRFYLTYPEFDVVEKACSLCVRGLGPHLLLDLLITLRMSLPASSHEQVSKELQEAS